MRVPADMIAWFSLPPIDSGLLMSFGLEGVPQMAGPALLPCITVMPMGFSWALLFSQAAMRNAIQEAGFSPSRVIYDGEPGVVFRTADDTAAAGYVDICFVLGQPQKTVKTAFDQICVRLRS
eukprot:410518-Pyramimonas_sp.AAC.1